MLCDVHSTPTLALGREFADLDADLARDWRVERRGGLIQQQQVLDG